MTNRRDFLSYAGLAPAAAAGAASAAPSRAAEAGTLRRATFAPLVGEMFMFQQSAFASVGLRLAEVAAVGRGASRASSERAFSLRFAAPPGGLAQDSYRVSHPSLGAFVLFVTPVDPEGRTLEAVFNLA